LNELLADPRPVDDVAKARLDAGLARFAAKFRIVD
jgi:hypothetical protein